MLRRIPAPREAKEVTGFALVAVSDMEHRCCGARCRLGRCSSRNETAANALCVGSRVKREQAQKNRYQTGILGNISCWHRRKWGAGLDPSTSWEETRTIRWSLTCVCPNIEPTQRCEMWHHRSHLRIRCTYGANEHPSARPLLPRYAHSDPWGARQSRQPTSGPI